MTGDPEHVRIPGIRPAELHGEALTWFEHCQQRRLMIQRCAGCERHIFYPRSVCPHCGSLSPDWVEASGRGVVHSYTWQNRLPPGIQGKPPVPLVLVELNEGVRMLSTVVNHGGEIHIGERLVVDFAYVDDDFLVPVFVPQREPVDA